MVESLLAGIALLAFGQGPTINSIQAQPHRRPSPVGFVADVSVCWGGQKSVGRVVAEPGGRVFVEGVPESHRRWLVARLQPVLSYESDAASRKGEWSHTMRMFAVVADRCQEGESLQSKVIAVHEWNSGSDGLDSSAMIAIHWRKVHGFALPGELRIVEARRTATVSGSVAFENHRLLDNESLSFAQSSGK